MNKIALIGNLTSDPELRTTPNGVSVCSFRIAVNRWYKDASGNQQTDYISIVCWRQLAENCGKFLSKGKKVGVVGSLQSRSYEDKEGKRRTAYDVVADDVDFLTPKEQSGVQGETEPVDGFADISDESLPF